MRKAAHEEYPREESVPEHNSNRNALHSLHQDYDKMGLDIIAYYDI